MTHAVYEFTPHTTVLTLRHNIQKSLENIKLTFTDEHGETFQFNAKVGNTTAAVRWSGSTKRRNFAIKHERIQFGTALYDIEATGVVSDDLETVELNVELYKHGLSSRTLLEDPNFTLELTY